MSREKRNRPAVNEAAPKVLADYNQSTALITSCVEVDLRGLGKMQPEARNNRTRWASFSLDGIGPGDVVKIIVDRDSFFCFHGIDFRGVRIQITANDVHTRKRWERQFAEVVA